MANEEVMSEIKIIVPESMRMKVETIKNRFDFTSMGTVFVRALVFYIHCLDVERQGGKVLLEIPGHKTTHLKVSE